VFWLLSALFLALWKVTRISEMRRPVPAATMTAAVQRGVMVAASVWTCTAVRISTGARHRCGWPRL
jgi:hypothetical protein